MTDDRPSDLLSALPRSRPHRRSEKRPARAASAPEPETQEAKPAPKKTTAPRAAAKRRPPKSTRGAAHGTKPPKGPAAKSARPASKTPQPASRAAGPAAVRSASAGPAGPRRQPRPLAQPAQPRGVPRSGRGRRPEPSTEFPVLRTALQAAAELGEIGVTLSAKALRGAISRLPRP